MAIEPVKIPQNVYIEDRIIGPITLRQIFMVLIGAGGSYFLWAIFTKQGMVSWQAGSIASLPTIFMVAFAFLKINGISLFRMCLLIIEGTKKPSMRRWQPRVGLTPRLNKLGSVQKSKKRKAAASPPKQKNVSDISNLSSILDSHPLEGTTT